MHIWKEDITYLRIPVPCKHRVDSFGELSTTLLIDAAGIYPNSVKAIFQGNLASFHDLQPAIILMFTFRKRLFILQEVLMRYFLSQPAVRDDSIRRDVLAKELLKEEISGMKKSHFY